MIGLAEALTTMLPGKGRRPLDPDERASVEDVLDAAAEWRAGTLPQAVALGTGAIEAYDQTGELRRSPGYGRFVALVVTLVDDPRRADLLALIDAVIDRSGFAKTHQGMVPAHLLGRVAVPGKEAA